jgi:hypothetical protein
MLSRARNGLILVGNADTFRSSRKGKEVWTQFFNLLNEGGNMYKGLPVKCVKHPEKTTLLCRPADFDEECPGGGCKEPWWVPSSLPEIIFYLIFSTFVRIKQ